MSNALNCTGKPWWLRPFIVLANLTTLWKCRACKQTYPHYPFSGKRAHYAGRETCKSCRDTGRG